MRRWLLGALALVVFVAAIAYALRVPIAERLIPRVVAENVGADLAAALPDGLHVVLCGAGSPFPDPRRSGPCTGVIAGGRVFIVDAGSGAWRNLGRMRVAAASIEAILLTHFHSDHIDGLGELLLQRWAGGGRTSPTPIYGPEGVTEVVDGFNLAYAADQRYRVAHHGEDVVPSAGAGAVARPFAQPPEGIGRIVIDDGGLVVTAFRVSHPPIDPAVGYRFDYKGRSVVLSGDTIKSANLQHFAQDVDLLVHEALSPRLVGFLTAGTREAGLERLSKITEDILEYHATPVEAAEVARDAGARHLLYNHIVPPLLLPPMVDIFLEGVAGVYGGPVTVGVDGILVELEAGSDSIRVTELF